jgi:hypothetical protein
MLAAFRLGNLLKTRKTEKDVEDNVKMCVIKVSECGRWR